MRRLALISLLFLGLGGFLITQVRTSKKSNSFVYLITETAGPTSFDPLDADNTNNLPPARMIYATPLEASDESQITSQILSSFTYNLQSRSLNWTLKDDLYFDDGTPITADEVAFAVARMAFSRPNFPVIKDIVGMASWLKSKNALASYPEGIQVERNKIRIIFDKETEHPMFRFCLELFSIIPKKCVDLETGKINCDKIPASGHYRLVNKSEAELIFQKRNDLKIGDSDAPKEIIFRYKSPEVFSKDIKSILADNVVAAGNELQYSVETMKELSTEMSLKHLPASRFAVIQLNQDAEPFKDRNCRLYFANTFRQINHEITGQPIESSVFTKILNAYESHADLDLMSRLTSVEVELCRKRLQTSDLKWGFSENDKESLFFKVLRKTIEQVGMKVNEPTIYKNRADFANAFAAGDIDIFNAGSGFWALDPAGDLKMLFTPKLHKPLNHITKDDHLQKLLGQVNGGKENFKKVSQYLFHEAKFNVYTHPRRFFVAHDRAVMAELPFAITSPAPWQVFRVK